MTALAWLQLARRSERKPAGAPPAAPARGRWGREAARAPEPQGLQTPPTQFGVKPLQTVKALQAGLAPQ
jgi:hypothetical protein